MISFQFIIHLSDLIKKKCCFFFKENAKFDLDTENSFCIDTEHSNGYEPPGGAVMSN